MATLAVALGMRASTMLPAMMKPRDWLLKEALNLLRMKRTMRLSSPVLLRAAPTASTGMTIQMTLPEKAENTVPSAVALVAIMSAIIQKAVT